MEIQESSDQDGNYKQQQNSESRKWLNLKIGRNSESASTKVYLCNFCRRKFFSAQALGGHQNAHRKERNLLLHYCHHDSQNHYNMMMNNYTTSTRSSLLGPQLQLQPHSYIHKPARRDMVTVTRIGSARQPEAAASYVWPGSSQFDPPRQSPDTLDLDLKL